MEVTDEQRRAALRKFRALDEQSEALRLRSLDLHSRYRDAIRAKREAERAVAEERQRLARTIGREELDPRIEREAAETAAEVERLEAAHAEASEAWKAAKQLVDACHRYLVERGANPDAPLAREAHYTDTRSRGAERVAFRS